MSAIVKTIKSKATDDTIYPVTKADAVYLTDTDTSVEQVLLVAEDQEESTGEVSFNSQDTELNPGSTTSVDLLQSTDSWSQRFVKISQMFKNIRYILSKIGNTSISGIGDSTLTGAVSTLNNNSVIAVTANTTLSDIAVDGSGGVDISINLPAGYTAVGFTVAQTSNQNRFVVWGGSFSNTSVRVMYINHRTSAATVNVRATVFATKTS